MSKLTLPYWMVEKIRNGQSILFLGAGASRGATGKGSEKSLSGQELRNSLCDKFLNGAEKSKSLARVAALCINESSLSEVQNHVRDLFEPLNPSIFHLKIPSFKWHSIITVNYDLIVERSYDSCENKKQFLARIVRDGDDFDKKISDPDALPFLKLHGCINAISDHRVPLILSSEQYAKYKENRILLFKHFKEWALQYPVIFCGYDISDPNIHTILFDLTDMGVNRPAYLNINPSLSEYDLRYWSSKRITPIKASFEDFLNYIDEEIPEHKRVLSKLVQKDDVSISKWISSQASPSSTLFNYFESELEHIYQGIPLQGVSPKDFYRGIDNSWGALEQKLDIDRKVTDEIISDAILDNLYEEGVKLYLLKGYAGSGKSIVLKRVIFTAAIELDLLVFMLRTGGVLRPDLIREIFGLINKRVIILIEDAIPDIDSIINLTSYCEKEKVPLTLLLGARTNEWNVYGDQLENKLTQFWELRNLSEKEIASLIDKLEEHDSLGELKGKSREDQKKYFKLSADRQLLVALHEATYGKPFREIVFDEYQKIVPIEAKVLYLDICSLNRLGVGVRAGLISRISGINYNLFKEKLLKPLQHVVKVYFDKRTRDFMYKCRHPQIAKLVFDQALSDQEERADQITRILQYLNVDYNTDDLAFSQIIKGRNVAELFSHKTFGDRIYKVASETGAPLGYIYHQNAVFELNHPAGDIRKALAFVKKAEAKNKIVDKSLMHTKAIIYRRLSLITDIEIEKFRSRGEAKKILDKLLLKDFESYSVHTYIQILLDEIEEKINEFDSYDTQMCDLEKLEDRVVVELLDKCERLLYKGLQLYPDDKYLLSGEASLAALINDRPRFDSVLKNAIKANPYSGFIAVRLSRHYIRSGNYKKAQNVLFECLGGSANSKSVHLEIAKNYQMKDETKYKNEILSHLRKSFTDGDTNYDAQFWFARQNFIYGEINIAEKYFDALRKVFLPLKYKNKIRAIAKEKDSSAKIYQGSIKKKFDNYCFIHTSELNCDLFGYYKAFKNNYWENVSDGSLLKFNLGFTLKGPTAINIQHLNS